jgi:hypothetical protein
MQYREYKNILNRNEVGETTPAGTEAIPLLF